MMVNGKEDYTMGKVNWFNKMEISPKEFGAMATFTEKELKSAKMAIFTKATFTLEDYKEKNKVSIQVHKKDTMLENSKTAKWMD